MPALTLERVARAICHSEGWQFGSPVGAGAFKETYRITDAAGTPLALKVFRSANPTERVQREVEAMLRCSHQSIARVLKLELRPVDGVPRLYLIEEYLAGGSLSSWVGAHGLLDVAATRRVGAQLIDALQHLEQRSLVHRDLKPDNVMLRHDIDSPVIVDFGLVRMIGASSLTHSWLMQGPGTPYFAPPEQLRNEKAMIDWRADQFSLGVMLSASCLGLHPYARPHDTPDQVVLRVAARESPDPAFVAASAAAGLSVLTRMVAPWPVDRFRLPPELASTWAALP